MYISLSEKNLFIINIATYIRIIIHTNQNVTPSVLEAPKRIFEMLEREKLPEYMT